MKKKTITYFTLLLLIININSVGAESKINQFFNSKHLSDNIFKSVDYGSDKIEDALLTINLKGNDSSGDMTESLEAFCENMGFKVDLRDVTEEKLMKIYNNDKDGFKSLLSMLEPDDRGFLTQAELQQLIKVFTSYVEISKQSAEDQTQALYKISNIGVYSDGNTDNSPFDLIEDLDDINAMIYGEEDEYGSHADESGNTGNLGDLLNFDVSDASQYEDDKNSTQASLDITQANVGQNVVLNSETKDAIELALGNINMMTYEEFREKFLQILEDLNIKSDIIDGIIELIDEVIGKTKLKENIKDLLEGFGISDDIIEEILTIIDDNDNLTETKEEAIDLLTSYGINSEDIALIQEVFDNIGIPKDVIEKIDSILTNAGISTEARTNLKTFLESFGIDKTLEEQADYIGGKLRCVINESGLSLEALDAIDNPANRNENNSEGTEGFLDYLTPGFAWGDSNTSANNGTAVYNTFGEMFPCSPEDVFCILLSMKSYTQNMVGEYKQDEWGASTASIISHYNEFFREGAYSSLSQKRMTINNFEFGYPLDLVDLFSTGVYLSYEPIPIYNLEENEDSESTNSYPDDFADRERLLKNTFKAYSLDYDRQNDLTLLTKRLQEMTNLTNSSSQTLQETVNQNNQLTDMLADQKNQLKKIELDIEKLTNEQSDFSDFNTSFIELIGVFKVMNSFSYDLGSIIERMKRVPTK